MKLAFDGDLTLGEGPLSCGFNEASGAIKIDKTAFPFVAFSATPQYKTRTAQIYYAVMNPIKNVPSYTPTSMPCRFEVSEHNKVFLQLNGMPFHQAHEAARNIMERLFTLQ
jgi:hypothetical protein